VGRFLRHSVGMLELLIVHRSQQLGSHSAKFKTSFPLQKQQGSAVADKSSVMHCITANVLQTNTEDAQCDKLATKLS